jgi:hypothetical protein
MSLENPKEQPNHTYSTTAINLALGGGVIDGHGLRGSNGGAWGAAWRRWQPRPRPGRWP